MLLLLLLLLLRLLALLLLLLLRLLALGRHTSYKRSIHERLGDAGMNDMTSVGKLVTDSVTA